MIGEFGARILAVVAALVVLFAVFSGLTPTMASAAHLDVGSAGIVIDAQHQRCTFGALPVTAPVSSTSGSTLWISGVAGDCVGQPVTARVVGTNGSELASGTVSQASAGTTVVTLDQGFNTSNVANVALFFGTWWINSTWSKPAAVTCQSLTSTGALSGQPCSITNVNVDVERHGIFLRYETLDLTFDVSPTPAGSRFQVTINFADTSEFANGSSLPGWTPGKLRSDRGTAATTNASCNNLPILQLRGTGGSSPTRVEIWASSSTGLPWFSSSTTCS